MPQQTKMNKEFLDFRIKHNLPIIITFSKNWYTMAD